jgi:hypothetical protein
MNDIAKLRKFQRSSTLKPVEPAIVIFEIFKNLMLFSIWRASFKAGQAKRRPYRQPAIRGFEFSLFLAYAQ